MDKELLKKRIKELKDFIENTNLKDIERFALTKFHNSLVQDLLIK